MNNEFISFDKIQNYIDDLGYSITVIRDLSSILVNLFSELEPDEFNKILSLALIIDEKIIKLKQEYSILEDFVYKTPKDIL